MKKNKRTIYLVELIILIYIIFFGIFARKLIPDYMEYVNAAFWIILFMYLLLFHGFIKDRNYLKRNAIKIVIITLLMYFLVTFLSGFLLGFSYGIIELNLGYSIYKVVIYIITFIFMELCRYTILKRNPSKDQIIMYAILTSINMILLLSINTKLDSLSDVFILISTVAIPAIANEFLYTYITYEVSLFPCIIYKIIIECYAYLLPVLPNLGDYLISITGVLLPFITYILIRKEVVYHSKKELKFSKFLSKYFNTIIICFLFILVSLTSGLFKYQLVSIVSNSMLPTYAEEMLYL